MIARKVCTWFLILSLVLPLWPLNARLSLVQAAPEVGQLLPVVARPLAESRAAAPRAPLAPTSTFSVTQVTPPNASIAYMSEYPFVTTFNMPISPTTANSRTLVLHGTQSQGVFTNTIYSFHNNGKTVKFASEHIFLPGELIMAMVTTGTRSIEGDALFHSVVWTVRASVLPSQGFFTDTYTYGVSNHTNAVCLADFDKNGHLDVATGIGDWGQNQLWLSNSDDSFTTQRNYGSGSENTASMACIDMNNDGTIDIVLGNWDAPNTIWLNDGNANFTLAETFDIVGYTYGIAAGDFDGDGDFDIVSGNNGNQKKIFFNGGEGHFSSSLEIGPAAGGAALASGDLDNDGDIDIVIGGGAGSSGVIYFNSGQGAFQITQTLGINTDNIRQIAIGDADNDGDFDLAFANWEQPNVLYVNDGTGQFPVTRTFGTGSDRTYAVEFADMDGDNDLDIAVGNGHWLFTHQSVLYLNDGNGNFTSQRDIGIPAKTYDLAIGDIDNDGDLDIVNASMYNGQNYFYINPGVPNLKVSSLTPNTTASNAGNLPILITGENLRTPITATLGATALLSVTLENTATLHAVVPVGSLSEGAYTLTVHSAGTPLALTHAFTVTAPVAPTQFRVMVVAACDNNLATHCYRMLNEFEMAMLANPDLHILVLWDGPAHGDSAYYVVQPDADEYQLAGYVDGVNRFPVGEANTGDPSTIVAFAAWAQANYPGHYTMLSLVGHGGGWGVNIYPPQPDEYEFGPSVPGMLWDDSDADTLSTREMRDALAWLTAADKLDVAYYDGCLMGQVEVLAEIGFASDYVIAHENLTWSRYPYADYFGAVTTATLPADFVQHIAATYRDLVLDEPYPGEITVWDTTAFSATVLPATDAVAVELLTTLPTATHQITTLIAASAHVEENLDGLINAADHHVDLYDLALNVAAHPGMPQAAQDAAQALIAALDAVRVVNYTQSGDPHPFVGSGRWDLSDLHGLSIYAPLTDEWRRPLYGPDALPTFATTRWDDFIQALHAESTPPVEPPDDDPPAPIGNALQILNVEIGLNQTFYALVYAVVQEISGVVSIQLDTTASVPGIIGPDTDLVPRMGDFFPAGSYTYTVATEGGWAAMLTLPAGSDPVSGTGVLLELPFTAQNVGCVDLRFTDHLLVDEDARNITHNAVSGHICVTDKGALAGNVALESRSAGAWADTQVVATGPRGVYTTTTDASGTFTLTGVYSDVYTVAFSRTLFVNAVRAFTITAGLTTEVNVGLWAGDMDDSGNVEGLDWHICAVASIPVSDPAFDINADGETNAQDCTLVRGNIGRSNMPGTNPPMGNVQARAALAAQSFKNGHSDSTQSTPQLCASDATLDLIPQVDGRLLSRIEGIQCLLRAAGARLNLPAGAQVERVALAGGLAGGFLRWHQVGAALYIVAAPVKGVEISNDSDFAYIQLREGAVEAVTVDAFNIVDTVQEHQIYLPFVTRQP